MNNRDDVKGRLHEILGPLAKEGKLISDHTELVADLGLDSMQVMELLSTIEDEFDISVPLNIVPEVRTVHDLGEQITKLIKT